jgi:uncharacterized RDD family membrane protein YckC
MATSRTPAQGSDEPSGTGSGVPDDEVPVDDLSEDDLPVDEAPVAEGSGADGSVGEATASDGLVLAEPGQRLLARIVDTLIVGLPAIIVVKAFVSGHDVDVVAPPVVAGCMLVYEAVQLALWGRTLGKRFAGIHVASDVPATGRQSAVMALEGAESIDEGQAPGAGIPQGPYGRMSVSRAVLRAAVYSVPIALRPVHILGLLASLFWVANAGFIYEGTRRQALHDRLAGTLVVKRPAA